MTCDLKIWSQTETENKKDPQMTWFLQWIMRIPLVHPEWMESSRKLLYLLNGPILLVRTSWEGINKIFCFHDPSYVACVGTIYSSKGIITVIVVYDSVTQKIWYPFLQSPSQNVLPGGPLCAQLAHLISCTSVLPGGSSLANDSPLKCLLPFQVEPFTFTLFYSIPLWQ